MGMSITEWAKRARHYQLAVVSGQTIMPCTDEKEVAFCVRHCVEHNAECEIVITEQGRAMSHNVIDPDDYRGLGRAIGKWVLVRTAKGSEAMCKLLDITKAGKIKIERKGKITTDWPHNIMFQM